ncbi:uncharacterized protein At4g15970-like [Chenopodium quinoa]|uniref:uncharacterized protein At4g15970-like n=1 Tax=Chenopodium quinoa TaxID=63459 RepID=UPI000B78EA45|nr:uncharacterized protein At4g15970-like [Chenopodium quinoa]
MVEIKGWSCPILNLMNSSSSSSTTTRPCNFVILLKIAVLISTLAFAFLVLSFTSPFNRFNRFSPLDEQVHDEYYELRKLLKAASTKEKTVILTYLNEAWAAPNSIFDIFLESFRIGNNTAYLLNHLLVIAVDDDAYTRCQTLVSHCYLLKTNESSAIAHQANFMTPLYLDILWRRLAFLQTILTLEYNFIITDTDVVWFRDPFPHFITDDSDFQTSCDRFNGDQYDLNNFPNMGFLFARSNNRTIKFYDFWVSSKHLYPHLHEQDAFNRIKHDPVVALLGLKIRFLNTDYFSGFCSPSRDFNKVCTMHANCCVGLDRKIADLKTALEDWKTFISANQSELSQPFNWSVPNKCLYSFLG